MAGRSFSNSRIYTGHIFPVLIDCNFVVDSTNGNGLGIRNLKGPYVQNVFMNTSATPGVGNSNPRTPNIPIVNPNPAAGTIIVQLDDSYNRIYTGGHSIVSPLGSSVTSITAGVAYVITSLGTATLANWQSYGVPKGLVPSVGMAFVAAASVSLAGSATVAPTASAGSSVFDIEIVGDTNQAIGPNISAQGFGSQIILQCRNAASGGASEIAAPANNSVISLSFLLSNSSILVQGE